MPIDDDAIVTVEEFQDVLSAAEKAILQQQITHQDALTEEWMIQFHYWQKNCACCSSLNNIFFSFICKITIIYNCIYL